MWEYVIGGATIFAFIMGIFSFYNGRATRSMIVAEERETRKILEEMRKETREFLKGMERAVGKLSEQHETMIKILKSHSRRGKRHSSI